MTPDGDHGPGEDRPDTTGVRDPGSASTTNEPRLIPDRQWGTRPGPPGDDQQPSGGSLRDPIVRPAAPVPRPEPAPGPGPRSAGPAPIVSPEGPARRRPTRWPRPEVTATPVTDAPPRAPAPSIAAAPSAANPTPAPLPTPLFPPDPHMERAAEEHTPAIRRRLDGPSRHEEGATTGGPGAGPDPQDRPPQVRTPATLTDLAQQLAATQAQVASLSAQLTTLAHRLTYDLERGAQQTSERVVRDLGRLPDQVSHQVGMHLGPAIDDLTDQIEADGQRLIRAVEGTLAARITGLGEAVDALPLGNVELVSSIESLGADIQDRLTRFSTRTADQVQAIETATTAELGRLRAHLDDLEASLGQPSAQADTLERVAGLVERLAQQPSLAEELIEPIETIIEEHLEVISDNLDARVSALAPTLHEELEAVRDESLAGTTATEELLAERVEALEHVVLSRVDAAMAAQIDAVDALIADRNAELLAELRSESSSDGDEDPMAGVVEELQALRRRIKLRFETGDTAGLNTEQLAELAKQVADHLR